MPSQTEIARHWGVSQPYVAKLVKKGCPTNSLRAADNWRNANARQRAPTNAKGSCKFAVVERIPRRKFLTILKPSNTGDSLLDVLNNCLTVANCAFEEYDHARLNNSPTLSARISDHSRALMAYIKMERLYRQALELEPDNVSTLFQFAQFSARNNLLLFIHRELFVLRENVT